MTSRIVATDGRIWMYGGRIVLCDSCKVVASCQPVETPTGVGTVCCPSDVVPETLCVKAVETGGTGCFNGKTFPIFYQPSNLNGCQGVWLAYGTPPAAVGCVDWYQDGPCQGGFQLKCLSGVNSGWQVVTSSNDYCTFRDTAFGTLGVLTPTAVQCNPFQLTFVANRVGAGGAHICPAALGPVTITVSSDMSQCPGWQKLAYLRSCVNGVPTNLSAVFTLTSGSESGGSGSFVYTLGLNGMNVPLSYCPCTCGANPGGTQCALFISPFVNLPSTGVFAGYSIQVYIGFKNDGTMFMNSVIDTRAGTTGGNQLTNGQLTIDSCGPPATQFHTTGIHYGGTVSFFTNGVYRVDILG